MPREGTETISVRNVVTCLVGLYLEIRCPERGRNFMVLELSLQNDERGMST